MSAGFDHPVNLVVEDLLAALDDPALPLLQWGDRFSAAAARLPPRLADQLEVSQHQPQRWQTGTICRMLKYSSQAAAFGRTPVEPSTWQQCKAARMMQCCSPSVLSGLGSSSACLFDQRYQKRSQRCGRTGACAL